MYQVKLDWQSPNTVEVTGTLAFTLAKLYGAQLHKYADPIEGATYNIGTESANYIAKWDPSLIYASVPGVWVRNSTELRNVIGDRLGTSDAALIEAMEDVHLMVRATFPVSGGGHVVLDVTTDSWSGMTDHALSLVEDRR